MPVEINQKFFDDIYAVVARIPVGKVVSYGQIGSMAGYPGSAREVGYAMAHAPAKRKLPCHRVVNSQGTLAPEPVFGGQARQRAMLEEEGVTFFMDGRIKMERHTWSEYEQLSFF